VTDVEIAGTNVATREEKDVKERREAAGESTVFARGNV